MNINKKTCVAVVLFIPLILAGVLAYGRYVRPRAYPHAGLVVSTPYADATAVSGIVPIKEPVVPGMVITFDLNNFTFKDPDHTLAVDWDYQGGLFHRDVYKFSITVDGVTHTETRSPSDGPVELWSQDGYKLSLVSRHMDIDLAAE